MVEVKFSVPGEPTGKGRPRFVARYNPTTQKAFGQAHTPDKTVVYENLVRTEYRLQCGEQFFSEKQMLEMRIMAYYQIPKSASKKKREQMLTHQARPTKKPDSDNVIKVIADSLNNVAYHDDSQIVDVMFRKFYSDKPRVEVTIKGLEE